MYNVPAKTTRSEECVVCGRTYHVRPGCFDNHKCSKRFVARWSRIERCLNDIDDPASSATWEDLEEMCLRLGFSFERVKAEYA